MKKAIVFILTCIGIAVILPIGYFLFDLVIYRTTFAEAGKDFLLSFMIMFVVTLVYMLYSYFKEK